jgi:hypothetical protein
MTEAETALWSRVYADSLRDVNAAILQSRSRSPISTCEIRETCAAEADAAVAMLRERTQ